MFTDFETPAYEAVTLNVTVLSSPDGVFRYATVIVVPVGHVGCSVDSNANRLFVVVLGT